MTRIGRSWAVTRMLCSVACTQDAPLINQGPVAADAGEAGLADTAGAGGAAGACCRSERSGALDCGRGALFPQRLGFLLYSHSPSRSGS
jgi:hypothetical protein